MICWCWFGGWDVKMALEVAWLLIFNFNLLRIKRIFPCFTLSKIEHLNLSWFFFHFNFEIKSHISNDKNKKIFFSEISFQQIHLNKRKKKKLLSKMKFSWSYRHIHIAKKKFKTFVLMKEMKISNYYNKKFHIED